MIVNSEGIVVLDLRQLPVSSGIGVSGCIRDLSVESDGQLRRIFTSISTTIVVLGHVRYCIVLVVVMFCRILSDNLFI